MPAVRAIAAGIMLAFALLLASPAAAQRLANHISAELVPEGQAEPGGTVSLAIAMTPEAGWHGYWSNPGDAGYGMQLDWSLPPGWQAGEPEYPVPQTLLISGLMNHVYEGPYAVIVPVSVPREAVPGARIPVTLEAQWLACTDKICVPERGMLATTIAVGSSPEREPRFDGWRAALAPLIDREGAFEQAGSTLRIAIPLPASLGIAAPHLFLAEEGLIDYAAPQRFMRKGDMLIVELRRRANGNAVPGAVSGILKLDDAGNGVRFVARPGTVPHGGEPVAPLGSYVPPPFATLLLLALIGGLLLNVMPCVFPILSLKALSLARAGESAGEARREGLAYTAGVVLACLVLGGLMLGLRAAGNEIGWAFQLQEPGVVAALLLLAVAITANFAGLFELPSLSLARGGQPLGAFATGLLAALREDEAERLIRDRTRFGPLLESFVVSEILKLASWSERRLAFSHYRTKDQDEVDVVIEDRRGRIIGIEVKASATVRAQDFRGLRQLQEAAGNRFVRGLVLHDHDRVTPFGEKLQAAPLSLLWSM